MHKSEFITPPCRRRKRIPPSRKPQQLSCSADSSDDEGAIICFSGQKSEDGPEFCNFVFTDSGIEPACEQDWDRMKRALRQQRRQFLRMREQMPWCNAQTWKTVTETLIDVTCKWKFLIETMVATCYFLSKALTHLNCVATNEAGYVSVVCLNIIAKLNEGNAMTLFECRYSGAMYGHRQLAELRKLEHDILWKTQFDIHMVTHYDLATALAALFVFPLMNDDEKCFAQYISVCVCASYVLMHRYSPLYLALAVLEIVFTTASEPMHSLITCDNLWKALGFGFESIGDVLLDVRSWIRDQQKCKEWRRTGVRFFKTDRRRNVAIRFKLDD